MLVQDPTVRFPLLQICAYVVTCFLSNVVFTCCCKNTWMAGTLLLQHPCPAGNNEGLMGFCLCRETASHGKEAELLQ